MVYRWAVVISKPTQERRAVEQLDQRGFECFFPQIKIRRDLHPLFPRYLFVVIEQAWQRLFSAPAVADAVRVGLAPALISDEIVLSVKVRCNDKGIYIKPDPDPEALYPGRRMRVEHGPFAGQVVRIDRLDGNGRVAVLMSMLNGQVRVVMKEQDLIAA